ncbi:SRPBCC family protein [Alkanindiges illinoisensis]|uniref:SRPBCC family protein n=1 Tax=Alkanindiges illinoisensis TaxID=197183 RepID=UPI0006849F1D|nr:SRPBCC family protein [Alkanindiges illinoisensis]
MSTMIKKASPAIGLGMLVSSMTFTCTASQAAIINWQDNVPSATKPFGGNAAQLARLVDNDIMVYSHPAQALTVPSKKGLLRYNNARFSSAAIIVPAKPEQVKQLLAQYSGYAGLFPTLTKATLLEQSGNITQMKYRIHVPVPIPVLSFNEDVVMQHQVSGNSIQTLIVDSPIQYGMGKFEWFPVDSTHTLVTLTQWGDLDKPKGFLVSTILKAIPEVKQGIPQSVDTFVLETLKRKFAPDGKLPTQGPRQLPYKKLQQDEIQLVQQLNARSGNPVMFIHRPVNMPYSNRAEPLQFVSTYATLRAPAARSTQVLGSPANFKNMFSQVSKVELKPLGKQITEAAVTVKVGLGVIAIPFKINLRYYNEPQNRLYYQANGGDIEYMQGQMQFSPLANQQTFLSMTSAGKIGDNAPFLLKIGKSLPYSDLLPTVGGAPVFIYKANEYLSKNQSS